MNIQSTALGFGGWLLGGLFLFLGIGGTILQPDFSVIFVFLIAAICLPPIRARLVLLVPALKSYKISIFAVVFFFLLYGAFGVINEGTDSKKPIEVSTSTPTLPHTAIKSPEEIAITKLASETAAKEAAEKKAQAAVLEKQQMFASNTSDVARIAQSLKANEDYLKKYYGTKVKLEQTQKDILTLVMIKVDYLDHGKTPEEKTLGKRAEELGYKLEAQARRIYASVLEEAFVKDGKNFQVSTEGGSNKQLRISYILMSKPLVYKFQNDIGLDKQAISYGFTKLIYTNGAGGSLGETWTVNLLP